MEMKEIIEQAEGNIRTAVADYSRYTNTAYVMNDISDKFIARLARDSSLAKMELREMFSRSPAWDSKLDALVINGTRTHDPDYSRISALAFKIFGLKPNAVNFDTLDRIVGFFAEPDNENSQREGISAIASVAPKAYAPGKKRSRVFKAVCEALGVADEAAGSEFQKLYAQFADELASRKISFKLFVSINPAHFLTMSNPKNDRRGDTLTSCHSLNSTQYQYNGGCAGYARDRYSFIVFTVADPSDRETLNNRKTTRQIFAYRPGNGLLMQSRFYNTSGGVYGAAEDSKLYRDLVQREISAIEGVPNLWKTYPYSEKPHCVRVGEGFGGYPDWTYDEFHGKVSIRADHENDYYTLQVGTSGLCINCAQDLSGWLYCPDCGGGCRGDDSDEEYCECCESYHNSDDMHSVRDSNGNEIWVCSDCLDRHYTYCEHCEEYYPNSLVVYIDSENNYYCKDCVAELCEECEECGELHLRENMTEVVRADGRECWFCNDCCRDNCGCCDMCGRYVHDDDAVSAFLGEHDECYVCPDCAKKFDECEECGRLFKSEVLQDGYCPECSSENREEESA